MAAAELAADASWPSALIVSAHVTSSPRRRQSATKSAVHCHRSDAAGACGEAGYDKNTDRDGNRRGPCAARRGGQFCETRRYLTGVTLYGTELNGKRIELFREAIPGIKRIEATARLTYLFWCGRWDSNPHDVAIEGF